MHPVVRSREGAPAHGRPARGAAGPGTPPGPARPPLRPAGPGRRPGAIRAESVAVLRITAERLLYQLPELTDLVLAAIRAEEPQYRSTAGDAEELWQEVNRTLRDHVGCLIRPRELAESARRCSWRIGAERARQGMPLDAVLHAFRLGGGTVWQRLIDTASDRDPESARLLVHVAADVWSFVDRQCAIAAEAYRRTDQEILWRRGNRLRLMTGALLDGTARIAELPDIAAALGLPERGRYVVAGVTGSGREQLRQHLDLPQLVWHQTGSADFALSAAPERGPEELAAALAGPAARLPVRVGVSPVAEGLASVGQARILAEKALLTCPGEGEVTLLHQQLTAALLLSAPDLGQALAERVLGPLLRLDAAEREVLLATLTVWLECDASAQRAGERLSCHRNTVLNRLRRCEKLTGRSFSRPREITDLSLALTALRVLSSAPA